MSVPPSEADRHERLGDLFLAASELPPAERLDFVRTATRDDPALGDEVCGMLAAQDSAPGALESDALQASGATDQLLVRARGESDWIAEGVSLGAFTLLRPIGEGGMGVVWQARQESPSRTVAIKILRPSLRPDTLRRFELEGEVLGRLKHPAIAAVFEAGVAAGPSGEQPYLALEWIEGAPLDRYANELRLDLRARVHLVERVARGVHHAHQRGVVHRDLKPANILVGDDGQPKILDFGVARVRDEEEPTTQVTRVGEIVGTLGYMSPEQVAGDPAAVDTRADVYALGVIAYELLAGRRPIDVGRLPLTEALRRIAVEAPVPLASVADGVPLDLVTVVHKALEKDPDRRYPSVEAFAADLGRFLRDEPVEARPPSAVYQVSKFVRRHRGATIGAAAAVAAVLMGAVLSTLLWLRERDAREQAVEAGRVAQHALDSATESLLDSRRRLSELQQTNRFFEGLVGKAMPGEGATDATLASLLRRSVPEIPRLFPSSPRQRAWLHGTAGFMLAGLGELASAREQVAAARELGDSMEPYLAARLADLEAGIFRYERNFVRAKEETERAFELLDEARALADEERGELAALLAGFDAASERQEEIHAYDLQELARTRVVLLQRRAGIARETYDFELADELAHEIEELVLANEALSAEFAPGLPFDRAETLRLSGDMRGAAAAAEDALERSLAAGRGDEWDTQLVRNTLGAIYLSLGRREDARPLVEEAYERVRELAGTSHPYVARLASNAATVARSVGDDEAAAELYRESIAMASEVLDWPDPTIAQTQSLYGSLLIGLGRLDEGEAQLQQSVDAFDELLDRDPSPELRIFHAFARSYAAPALRERGDFEGARRVLAEALEDKRDVTGAALHPVVEYELKELATTARMAGEFTRQAELELELAEFFDSVRGPGTRATARAVRQALEALASASAEDDADGARIQELRERAARYDVSGDDR